MKEQENSCSNLYQRMHMLDKSVIYISPSSEVILQLQESGLLPVVLWADTQQLQLVKGWRSVSWILSFEPDTLCDDRPPLHLMLYFKIAPSPESSSGCSHWSNSVVDVGAVRLMLRGGAVVLLQTPNFLLLLANNCILHWKAKHYQFVILNISLIPMQGPRTVFVSSAAYLTLNQSWRRLEPLAPMSSNHQVDSSYCQLLQ